MSDAQMIADFVQTVVTSSAIILGAVWAYNKFIKGRTFKPNLESTIAGEATRRGGFIHLVYTATAKNVGASKVDIQHRHTVFRVLAAKADPAAGAFEAIGWVRF